MGWIFILMAVILFFMAGIGMALVPNPMIWGLFCLALGMLVGGSRPTIKWD